jgi:hypothetical protein
MYAVAQGILPADINAPSVTGSQPPAPSVTANMYAVDVSGKSVDVVQELEFLDVLGLAYNPDGAPTLWYVSPDAAPLYRMFQNPLPAAATADDRKRVMKPIVDLFRNVLLPGRMWRIWTVRVGLADTIHEAHALDQQAREIQESQATLAGLFR